MKKSILITAALLFMLTFFLAACGGQQSESKTAEISVDMNEFTFAPASVTVPAGSEVTLKLTNSGTLEHSWIIMVIGKQANIPFDADDEANIFWQAKLDPAQSDSLTFTAPSEPGEYELVCGIPAHLEAGMKGTLIVE